MWVKYQMLFSNFVQTDLIDIKFYRKLSLMFLKNIKNSFIFRDILLD